MNLKTAGDHGERTRAGMLSIDQRLAQREIGSDRGFSPCAPCRRG